MCKLRIRLSVFCGIGMFGSGALCSLMVRGRIILRAATLKDGRLAMSSMAVLARSAMQILARYHDWYDQNHYNLIWPHLRQITTSAHIILLALERYEITKREAESSLSTAMWILRLSEPKWTDQASAARENIESVARAFGKIQR